ncbi:MULTISPECIES: Mu transposase C-terminal domain-containing protein [Bradyrhizobium]|uniref:Mu transposase C-terminal domain-containing protein n=1 Tax=Bradyrhizobium TaxID=374 RepID=UPI000427D8CC|nr:MULTISPECIES: Mu transposase C-terminal domain-containing protein [Bradyrhizobium]
MRNLIRNIIERLRGFIRNDAHDTTEPKVNDSTHPISDEAELDVDRGYTSTAVLTPSGILFKGIRYNSAALADMLPRMPSRSRVEVRIKDPSDASSIFVWDGTAHPAPRWITVPAVDVPEKMSFAEHARLRDYAKSRDLAFGSETERAEALQRLRRQWQELAEPPPMRERRTASACGDPTKDDIGIAPTESISFSAAEKLPKDRKPGKPALAKAKRTKARKMAEAKAKVPTRVSRTKRK